MGCVLWKGPEIGVGWSTVALKRRRYSNLMNLFWIPGFLNGQSIPWFENKETNKRRKWCKKFCSLSGIPSPHLLNRSHPLPLSLWAPDRWVPYYKQEEAIHLRLWFPLRTCRNNTPQHSALNVRDNRGCDLCPRAWGFLRKGSCDLI